MQPEEQQLEATSDVQDTQVQGSVFRQDGGAGSVMRERQPGYGGMDARPASAGQENWQNITSDRYGHPLSPEEATPADTEMKKDSERAED